jgi:uncharacterized tellurite resistance protein B-like protein
MQRAAENWVRLGLAIANADGHLDERELGVVRAAAARHSKLGRAALDAIMAEPPATGDAVDALLAALKRELTLAEALGELAVLHDVAVADGILRDSEAAILRRALGAFLPHDHVEAGMEWLHLRHLERAAYHRCFRFDARSVSKSSGARPRDNCDYCSKPFAVGELVESYISGVFAYGYFCSAPCRDLAQAQCGESEELRHQPRICSCERCEELIAGGTVGHR